MKSPSCITIKPLTLCSKGCRGLLSMSAWNFYSDKTAPCQPENMKPSPRLLTMLVRLSHVGLGCKWNFSFPSSH